MTQNQNKDSDSITQSPRWRVSARRTVNLGDYNSISLEAEYADDIPEGVKQSEFVTEMFERVSKVLHREFNKQGVNLEEV